MGTGNSVVLQFDKVIEWFICFFTSFMQVSGGAVVFFPSQQNTFMQYQLEKSQQPGIIFTCFVA